MTWTVKDLFRLWRGLVGELAIWYVGLLEGGFFSLGSVVMSVYCLFMGWINVQKANLLSPNGGLNLPTLWQSLISRNCMV